MAISIRNMLATDWDSVASIYAEGIATGNATFQSSTPSWHTWDEAHLQSCRLVAIEDDKILAWAALTPVSSRCIYAGVAEVSVYTSKEYRGMGIGRLLLQRLILDSETHGIWTLQSGIFPENKPSLALHHNCGFRTIGYREKIGQMNGTWRDTILLERRSEKIY